MKKRRYILGLDGLRALAILGVVFYHLTPSNVPGGFLGVNLFFLISGFLLTQKMSELMDTPIQFPRFFVKTVVKRIVTLFKPLLYTMVITLCVVFFVQPKLLQNIAVMFSATLAFVNNIVQIGLGLSYFERHFGQSIFTHFWYVSALVQMVIIWSIVYFILRKVFRSNIVVLIGLTVGIAASFALSVLLFSMDNITRVYYGTDTRIFDFLIGGWVALLYDDLKQLISKSKKANFQRVFGGLVALIVMLLLAFFAKDDHPMTYYFFFILFDVVAGYLLVVGLNAPSVILPVLESAPFRYVGKRSFEWYLWYFPVLTIMQSFLDLSNGLNVALIFMTLIVVSELFYQLFQKREIYKVGKIIPFYRSVMASIQQKKVLFSIVALIKYGLFPLFTLFVLATAPVGQNASVTKLQEQLEANEKLQAQQGNLTNQAPTQSTQSNGAGSSEKPTTTPTKFDENAKVTRQITFIGDSVTLSTYPVLKEHFPNSQIDGKVSRQFYHGLDVAKSLENSGLLYDEVVIFLGANSPFTKSSATAFLDHLKNKKAVYFVTIHGNKSWQNEMNEMMSELTKTYSNLKIIDWAKHSNAHSEWFLEDDVHPNTEGMDALVEFFYQQLK
ncbi:acetyltransferase [Carnobacteriaceae bacterium zg-ZUI252]|nr:acetyltransferase [Carnobacteriaceae bacterium zg-ZUI252]